MARIVDFFDGAQSETTPTIGNIVASDLVTYANDAAYEANEQGSPAEGNLYFNTTTKVIRYYNGTAWIDQADTTSAQTLENKVIDGSSTGNNDISTVATKVEVTPTGNLASDDVQEALVELQGDIDTHKTRLDDHDADILDLQTNKENKSEKGVANGYCPLDGSGLVPSANLPSFVDDVLEYANLAAFPVTGETGKIYVAINTNRQYRWTGSVYIDISGAVDSVNGQTGAVVLDIDDLDNVNISIPAAGNKLVYDGTNWVNVIDNITSLSDVDTNTVPPVIGDVLTFDGTNWVPDAPASSAPIITTYTTTSTISASDDVAIADMTSGNITLTMPTGIAGDRLTIKVINGTTNNKTTISGTIEGASSKIIFKDETFEFLKTSSEWKITNTRLRQSGTTTSTVKTPLATANFHSLANNSLTLENGIWFVSASGSFSNAGTSPVYNRIGLGVYASNGADNGTFPTALPPAGSSLESGQSSFASFTISTGDQGHLSTGMYRINVTAGPVTVYAVTYAEMTTPANARITAFLNVTRIGD